MSRIDEARRRLGNTQRWPANGAESATAPENDWKLEDYAGERASGTSHPAGSDPSERSPAPANGDARQRAWVRGDAATVSPAVDGGTQSVLSVEQYRRLAATLHDLQIERGLKVLMVTSALPSEGKTLTAVNLAVTLSESYERRVLLVDADLRHPAVHTLFGVQNTTGLSEVLKSGSSELPLVRISSRLAVLPGGHPTASPLAGLSSERMRDLLTECAGEFDWVILDTPPVGLLTDGRLLARLIGAVIFVIRADASPFSAVHRAIAELDRECIIGTVLNGVAEQEIPSNAYYDGYTASR
jgi:protein-tyrosine kinase